METPILVTGQAFRFLSVALEPFVLNNAEGMLKRQMNDSGAEHEKNERKLEERICGCSCGVRGVERMIESINRASRVVNRQILVVIEISVTKPKIHVLLFVASHHGDVHVLLARNAANRFRRYSSALWDLTRTDIR